FSSRDGTPAALPVESGEFGGGAPPTFGGWYVLRSSQVTRAPAWWSRAHSAMRSAVVSLPGLVSAPVNDQAIGEISARRTARTTRARRRRTRRRAVRTV